MSGLAEQLLDSIVSESVAKEALETVGGLKFPRVRSSVEVLRVGPSGNHAGT
jgi:hypothetical protein